MNRDIDTPAAVGPPEGEAAPERVLTIEDLITSDGEPVDSIYIEKQQRLLTETLDNSWPGLGPGRAFLATSNVGVFPELKQTPIVPDVMLAVDLPADLDFARRREHRSYFVWIMGKPPDVVFEFVSDRHGGEDGYKLTRYAQIGVRYYVICDPEEWLGEGVLRSFELQGGKYQPLPVHWFATVNLGVMLWEGTYAEYSARWLRWCDAQGRLIPTGAERAKEAERQADEAKRQADEAKRQADEERQRRERLEAQLRALGIEPPP